jgi:osmoprotectant transport system permease protein
MNEPTLRKKLNFRLITLALITCSLFIACSQRRPTLHMATKPMTEQYIIGSMMKDLIEANTNLKVELTTGVGGGTSNIEAGMEKGEFDFYPEYTGTGWNAVLKKASVYNESMFSQLQAVYAKMGMTWTGMLGFNNTFGLCVRRDIAEKYNLKTYSDLASIAGKLIFGAEPDFFGREDGYPALQKVYGIKFAKTLDIDIGLKYEAIEKKQIDAMNIFTTDGQLAAAPVKVLKDDKGLYPSYRCGFVVRQAVLKAHPELQRVFDEVTNILTDDKMAAMNYAVESEKKDPEEVAAQFLKDKGLLKK